MSFGLSQGTGFIADNLAIYLTGQLWAIVAFYFYYSFLYRYIEKHQFLKYFLLSILSTFIISVVFILLFRILIFPGRYQMPISWDFTTTAGTYIIANCGSLLRGFIGWIESSKLRTELEKRNLQLELDALRSQVNPHFLFNTLNNIDAFIAVHPQKASTMLIKLSDVMRYMLYQTNDEMVTVQMEINHLLNILELQKVRFSQADFIHFETEIQNPEQKIPPLLFIPFIENACKYVHFNGQLPAINIRMVQNGSNLLFECSNTFDINRLEDGNKTGGLGLENVKKRLALLFQNRYQLQIKKDGAIFFVSLNVQL